MSSAEADPLSPDGVFELLSNHRRRMVLYYLRTNGGAVDVQELATEIAAMENDVPADELTSQQRKRVYVSLYQTHLPKMAEMNTIEYDKDGGTVRLADRADDIDEYLTTEDRPTYPWRFHYLLLTVIGATALSLSALSAPVFGAVPLPVLGVAIVVVFSLSVVWQYWQAQNRTEPVPVELSRYDQ
ncbi:hypothetical protein C464_11048 [Halorubrum coriense DSM 10284]|uniref:DUF7344 domain-containing protein n=1 Tax=Halorubrum coriense DSM 10284 TaxID=1227466 RepID=M0EHG5_9EURY|nr:hypothetical protein [Halorubrum coriense]ELZ46347.1 hypothetical protein C464_11048 [Halorubrum coriense DSM 10284]